MSHWLRNWLDKEMQTRKFHPSWIVLTVVLIIVVASIIWIVAEWVAKAPLTDPERNTSQTGGIPATTDQAPIPVRPRPKTIWVDLSAPDAGANPGGKFAAAVRPPRGSCSPPEQTGIV